MAWSWTQITPSLDLPAFIAVVNTRMKQLEGALGNLSDLQQGITTIAVGDTTPSVSGAAVLKTANTGATSITTFDDGTSGRRLVLVFGDGNTTLVNGATLAVNGGANFTGAAGNTKEFLLDGTVWREISQPTTWN